MFTVKKIAIVTSLFPPSDERVAGYSYYLAKELTGMGIKVKVITSWKNESCGAKTVDDFTLACIPAKKFFNRYYFVWRKHYKDVAREIGEFSPDLVVANDYMQKLSLFAAKAAADIEIPCLIINHLTAPVSHRIKILDHFFRNYEMRMLYFIKKYRAVFAGASAPHSEHLKRMGAMPRYEIPYGVKSDLMPLPAQKKKLGLGDGEILCVMEGGDPGDVSRITDALSAIKEYNGPRVALAVIGEKPKDAAQTAEGAIYTGEISLDEDLSLKYGSDIYIHFEKKDSTGLGLHEAGLMSCAVLCILPDEGYDFTTARHMESGLVVANDLDEITVALQKLRVHTKLRRQLAEKLKSDIELKHSWNQGALALVDAAWELNGGRRRS